MQRFSHHTHTNALGIFDGRCTAEQMIEQAQKIGYQEIGISNHLVYHPNMTVGHPMFFNDYNLLEDAMMRVADEVRQAASTAAIKVYLGFEVDFFPSSEWCRCFEKLRKKLNADYYIGSFHYLRNQDESRIENMYLYNPLQPSCTEDEIKEAIRLYWQNAALAAESGYFDFIAHPDVYKIFPHFAAFGEEEDKWHFIETMGRLKHPYELNTSGWRKCGEQHPYRWMMEELNRLEVPVVISDDAHDVSQLANYFEQAEQLLQSLDYKKRWKLEK